MSFQGKYFKSIGCPFCEIVGNDGFIIVGTGIGICLDCLRDAADLVPRGEDEPVDEPHPHDWKKPNPNMMSSKPYVGNPDDKIKVEMKQ